LGLTFFGLTPKYRAAIFKQIHEIVFYGNGGYDWGTIYNMPIWLRNFTFNQINNSYVEKNKDTRTLNKVGFRVMQKMKQLKIKKYKYQLMLQRRQKSDAF
jgi:hypothetical protein